MFIKVTQTYIDTVFKATLPQGVILEVDEARAAKVIGAGKAEVFVFPAEKHQTKTKKSEEVKVEEPIVEKEIETVVEAKVPIEATPITEEADK